MKAISAGDPKDEDEDFPFEPAFPLSLPLPLPFPSVGARNILAIIKDNGMTMIGQHESAEQNYLLEHDQHGAKKP